MSKIFYEKRGNRYYPVQEYDSDLLDALPKGHHLISVQPGFRSTRRCLDPDYATLAAAGLIAREAVSKALVNVFDSQPPSEMLTPKQAELWAELKASFENSNQFAVYRKSTHDIAQQAVNVMIDEAKELLQIPAVKEAWDHYQLVAKLAKSNSQDN